LPVKAIQFNRCPAVAPMGVLDEGSQKRLQLDLNVIMRHRSTLQASPDLAERLGKALEILDKSYEQTRLLSTEKDVDACIYDGFFEQADKQALRVVRAAMPEELSNLGLTFRDHRLTALLPLYKARNFPKVLNSEERASWEQFRTQRLLGGGSRSRMGTFFTRLQEITATGNLTGHQEYLLEELKLYAESIMPETEE